MAKKKANNKKTGKSRKSDNWKIGAAVAILIVLLLFLIFYSRIFSAKDKESVAAIVNGEVITNAELDRMYSRVPEIYRTMGMTRETFLNDTIIPQRILVQEAARRGISASEEEVSDMIDEIISVGGITEEEFIQQLAEQNMLLEDFRILAKEQVMITKLLDIALAEYNIPDSVVKEFYAQNKELFAIGEDEYQPFSEVQEDIRNYLANNGFMDHLMENADIQIIPRQADLTGSAVLDAQSAQQAKASSGSSFTRTDEEICTEDGKPLVILFSTTTCPHCTWIKHTFDSVVSDYGDSIAAYHWELDINDNTLTSYKETSVPDYHLSLFMDKSRQGGVPAYVFGCKYYRIGNGFERTNDLKSEEAEFRAIIDMLLEA